MGITLRIIYAALMLCLGLFSTGPATAAPPAVGEQGLFSDPRAENVVVCDLLQQIEVIAAADDPSVPLQYYYNTPSIYAVNEPACAVLPPLKLMVLETKSLGSCLLGGVQYVAWAVRFEVEAHTYWLLHLEEPVRVPTWIVTAQS